MPADDIVLRYSGGFFGYVVFLLIRVRRLGTCVFVLFSSLFCVGVLVEGC